MTDLIIMGGGLAGGLCALALKHRRPELSVTLVDREDALGGNHVWSFFDSDIAPEDRHLVNPFVVQRWVCNAVRFPKIKRTFDTAYNSMTSERFDRELRARLDPERIVAGNIINATPTTVRMAGGVQLEAAAVLDARGFTEPPRGLKCGWQKFVGQMLEVEGGHGLTVPIIMDATVDQSEGYRFVYCLPFDDRRVFVEDTYYQKDRELDQRRLSQRIADYAAAQGWHHHRIVHEETGVLPVVMSGDFDTFWPQRDTLARAGTRGGFFHPLTSYSVPEAVRFAAWLAEAMPMPGAELGSATRRRAEEIWKRTAFDRGLARMLFDAADPPHRYRIMEHFYRLPAGLIERFYAGRSTTIDRARILIGKPPASIPRAIRALRGSA